MSKTRFTNRKCRPNHRLAVLLFASSAAGLATVRAVSAATYTYTSNASSNWSAATWSPSSPISGASTQLNFNGSTAYTATDDISGQFFLGELFLNSTATSTSTIAAASGDSLNFGTNGIIALNSSGAFSVTAPLNTAGGLLTVSGSGAGALSISGVIGGAGGFAKTSTANVTLSGINTYTGGTNVSAGSLIMGANNALPAGGAVTLDNRGNGVALSLGAYNESIGSLTMYAGSSIHTIVSGTGTLQLTGNLTLVDAHTGSQDYALAIANPVDLDGGTRTFNVGWGNNNDVSDLGDLHMLGAISNSTGTGGITIAAYNASGTFYNGTVTFYAANTYNGPTTLVGNTGSGTLSLYLNANNALPNLSALNMGSGTLVDLTAVGKTTGITTGVGSITGAGTIKLGSTGQLIIGYDNTSPAAYTGTINSSGGGIAKVGSGTLTLTGTNTYSGGTNLSGGILSFNGSAALGTGLVTFNGPATLQWQGTSTADVSTAPGLNIADGVTATLDTQANNVTLATALGTGASGTGGLVKVGSGILTLNAANTFSGGVNLSAGAISVGVGNALGTGTFNIGNGASASPFTAATTSAITVGNNIVLPSAAKTFIFTKNSAGQTTGTQLNLTGSISGGSSSTVLEFNSSVAGDSTTTYRLAGSNTFVGSVDINRGAIVVTNPASLGASTNKLILDSNGNSTLGNLRFENSMTLPNPIQLNAGYPINTDVNNDVLSGVVSGAGSFTKLGSGSLTLNAVNTYTGSTTVANGALVLASGSTIAGTTGISIASGTLLDNSANSAPITIGGASAAKTFFAGSTASNVDYKGNLTVSNGSSFSIAGPANPAVYTQTGNLNLVGFAAANSSAGSIAFDLSSSTTAPGYGNSDEIVVSGNLNLSGVTNVAVTPLAGSFAIGDYTLFTYGGTLTGGPANFNVSGFAGSRQTAVIDTTTTPGAVLLDVTGNPANLFWTGAVTNDFNSAGGSLTNWFNTGTSGADVFQNLDNVTFNDTYVTANQTINVSSNVSPSSLTFSNSAYSYTLSGTGAITGNSTTLTQNSGSVTINNVNTFAGGVFLNGGTMSVNTVANIGTGSSLGSGGVISFNGGSLLYTGATASTNRLITLQSGGGTIGTNTGTTLTLSGAINGSGGLTINGSGTVALSGSNSFAGPILISSGNLSVSSDASLGAAPSSSTPAYINISTGATLTTTGSFTLNANRGITGAGSVAVTSGSTLTMGSSNTYTGGTTLLGGSGLYLTNVNALGTGPLTIGTANTSGTFLNISGFSNTLVPIANNIVLPNDTGSSLISHTILSNGSSGSNIVQLNGSISGGGPASQLFLNTYAASGAGLFEFNGSNSTFVTATSKGITLNRGALQVDNATALGNASNGVYLDSYSPNTIIFGSSMSYGYSTYFDFATSNWNTQGYTVTVPALLTSTTPLQKVGTGALTLNPASGTDSLAGLIAAGGDLVVSGPVTATAAVQVNGGALDVVAGANLNQNTGYFYIGNGGSSAVFNMSGGTVLVGGTNQFIMSNTLTAGNTAFYNQTGGTFTVGTGSSFIGNQIPGASIMNISGGSFTTSGAFYLGVRVQSTLNITGGGTMTVPVLDMGYTINEGQFPTRTLNLGDGTTFSSGTSGTLITSQVAIPAASATDGSATLTFNGGTLEALNSSHAANFLQGLTNTYIADAGGTINTNGVSITIAQQLQHGGVNATDGGLKITGGGSLTLSGSNTYTGTTNVSGATLVVSNTAGSATGSGPVIVAGGGALGGSGTVSGPVTIAVSGNLFPGVGNTSIATTLTVGSGSVLGGNTILDLTAAGVSDEVVFGSTGSPGSVNLSGGSLTVVNTTGFGLAQGQTYTLLDYSSATGNFTTTSLPTLGTGLTWSLSSPAAGPLVLSVVTGGPATLTWNNTNGGGNGSTWAAGSGSSTYQNFQTGTGAASYFSNLSNGNSGDTVIFDDNNASNYNVQISGSVTPTMAVFNNSAGNYVVTAADSNSGIGGPGSVVINSGTGHSVKLSGNNNYSGGTTVNSGTLILGSAGAFPLQTNLTNTGTIDIGKYTMAISNSSYGVIFAQVAAAYNGGAWNASSPSGVITSSAAANDTTHLTAVGIATGLTSFEGSTVDPTDVLVKYTYYGDANLDGHVDGSDYSRIDNGVLLGLTGWSNGDFNYDGVINGSDYTLIDNAYNTQGAAFSSELASPGASVTAQIAGVGGVASAVPEPTTLGLLSVGAIGLLSRRRRR